mmetsp:Transcript_27294/g.72097  ORF Transcript_27294/g.72097 Transcript_27294/m.72097 type:complete len:229 (-) Transcript_27294:216-902(-)
MPAKSRAMTWPWVCEEISSSDSSPSALGRLPLMQYRNHWTMTKETHNPTTSSSVSSVASSHFSSFSSILPSSASAIESRTPSVTRPSMYTRIHANGAQRNRHNPFRGTNCCSVANVLIAAKPVMCPRRIAKHWRLTSMFFMSCSDNSWEEPPTAPEMSASASCRMPNHTIMWQTATESLNSPDASSGTNMSTTPLHAWKSRTAEKMEIVALMTCHEYLRSSLSCRFVR